MATPEMYLMPELIDIIQKFSRPLLRYPREYREAMRQLGIQEWPELKAKLSTPDAFRILDVLQSYLAAYHEDRQAGQTYMSGGMSGSNLLWAKAYKNRLLSYEKLNALL
jgi:hypothetical protein